MAGHGVSVGAAISGEIVVLTGVFGFQGAKAPDGIKLLSYQCAEGFSCAFTLYLT